MFWTKWSKWFLSTKVICESQILVSGISYSWNTLKCGRKWFVPRFKIFCARLEKTTERVLTRSSFSIFSIVCLVKEYIEIRKPLRLGAHFNEFLSRISNIEFFLNLPQVLNSSSLNIVNKKNRKPKKNET